MIRPCVAADIPVIEEIVNEAAERYRGVIPADCFHEPYMTREALESEIANGVRFSGWDEGGALVGVMGVQPVRDVTLIRHAYVRTAHQGRGIGTKLLAELSSRVTGPLLIGTWADAEWAIKFYQGHGFRLAPPDKKNRLLSTYWTIPDRQRETSVVLIRSARVRAGLA